MSNYMACTRPLWRGSVAQSLTIAVALLLEVGMLEQGLAAGCDCKQHPILHQDCKPSHPGEELRKAPANFGGPGSPKRDGAKGTLKDVVEWDEAVQTGKSLPMSTIKNRAKYVWKLPSNETLRENEWRNKTCICLNDEVCFPKTFPPFPIASQLSRLRHLHHVRSRVHPLPPLGGLGYRETPMFAPDATHPRNYNNPGLPDFQNGSRG
jgi:hypothetical protein